MNRSLIMSAALPLVLTACPSTAGDENADEADDGISTLGDTSNDTSSDTDRKSVV